jgi:polyisoprenoid-binding protein YceI
VTAQPAVRAGAWTVAPERARAGFRVRNFGVRWVSGAFAVRSGEVVLDAAGRPVSATAVLDVASFATGNDRRDRDVLKQHLLDVGTYPTITFTADRFEAVDGGWLAHGTLAVRDRRLPLDLTVAVEPADDGVRVVCRGVLDRAAAGVRAPRVLIGRRVEVDVAATLTAPD